MGAVCGVVGGAWGSFICGTGGWHAFRPAFPLPTYAQGKTINQCHVRVKDTVGSVAMHRCILSKDKCILEFNLLYNTKRMGCIQTHPQTSTFEECAYA